MQNTKFPKTVEFLKQAMNGQGDQALALELVQLVNELKKVSEENATLKEENAVLTGALEAAQEILREDVSDSPQYPDDFYIYGDSPLAYSLTDEQVQDLIDEVFEADLSDGEFYEQSAGDTIVIKTRDWDGVEKIIVAKNYAEFVIEDEEDEDDEEGCHPGCGCSHGHLL